MGVNVLADPVFLLSDQLLVVSGRWSPLCLRRTSRRRGSGKICYYAKLFPSLQNVIDPATEPD